MEQTLTIRLLTEAKDGRFGKNEVNTMTRQEAIERMVLAMHNEDIKRSIKDMPCDYRNLAEAALNALLEGK